MLHPAQQQTAATSATAPGGVRGAALWFEASGFHGKTWTNQSGSGLVSAQPAAAAGFTSPTALPLDANYNPGVAFNGTTTELRGSLKSSLFGGANSYIFAVSDASAYVPNVSTFGDLLSGYISCCDTSQGIIYFNGSYGDDLNGNHGSAAFTIPTPTSVQSDVYYATAGSGINAIVGQNGIATASSLGNDVASANAFEIGARTSGGLSGRLFNGSIDEVIYFGNLPSPLSATAISQIRSYLALKYGITLGFNTQSGTITPTNYLSSTGVTIWPAATNAGYDHDVAGIGADAASGLTQTVSHSIDSAEYGNAVDVTIANGTSVNTASQSANSPFTSDQAFVMWGNNGGSATVSTVSGVTRMARVWQTQVTGSGSTNVALQVPIAELAGIASPTLLVAADPNFQNSLQSIPLVCGKVSCGATIATFSATAQYFSFGPGHAAFNDYTTFGYDNQRDGFNPNSTAISPATVPNLHVAWQTALDNGGDSETQTQPILAAGISGHTGVLFVGGGSGNVYAYDATTGALMWTRNFGSASFLCGTSFVGAIGIGGSAAYDPASKSLYVVGNSNSTVDAYPNNSLYHLDGASGATLGSVDFTPVQVGPHEINIAHTSVTLANGMAYVGTGSTCDVSSWRGRVAAIHVPSMTLGNTFFTLWDPQNLRGQGAQPWGGASVWGWGGVSLDESGHVIAATGNADSGGNYGIIEAPFVATPTEYSGYAETVLELSANLSTVLASNHPIPLSVYGSENDIDVQGTPIVFKPIGCGAMLASQGKSGELSIYDETSIDAGPVVQFVMAPGGEAGPYLGGPAYSPATNLLYANVVSSASPTLFNPGLIAVDPGCGQPSVLWRTAFGQAGSVRPVPAASAGGVIFAGTSSQLYALDASAGTVLNGGSPLLTTTGEFRMPATIDGDWVFVIDQNGNLYGLTTDSSYPTVQVKYRKPTVRQLARWHDRT